MSIPSFQQIEQRVFGLNKFSKVSFGSKPGGQPKIGVIFLTATPYSAWGVQPSKCCTFPPAERSQTLLSLFRLFGLFHWRVPFYTISNGRLTVTDHQIGLSAHSAQCHSVSGSVKANQAQKRLSLCAFPPKWLYWRSPLISSN